VECSTLIFSKKCFYFYWRMCLYTCTRTCGFNMTVPFPILHAECTAGLTNNFLDRWIGHGGPITWHPHSSDLTPLDFCLWGCTKEKCYATEVWDHNNLINCTEVAAAHIVPRQLASVRGSIRHRYVQVEGGHFEHPL
jgi:hypothetical protein